MHMNPLTIPIIKCNNNIKLGGYCVKTLCRYPTPGKLDLYESKIYLFDKKETEEFLLFVRNFNMTLGRQEQSLLAQILSTFVQYYVARRYVNLACCLLRWEERL